MTRKKARKGATRKTTGKTPVPAKKHRVESRRASRASPGHLARRLAAASSAIPEGDQRCADRSRRIPADGGQALCAAGLLPGRRRRRPSPSRQESSSRYWVQRPIFEMASSSGLANLIAIEKGAAHPEARDIARAAGRHVPVAGDLDGVVFAQHGIEDRLVRQARRKFAHAGFLDQAQLRRPDRPPQRDGFFLAHRRPNSRSMSASFSST